MHRGVGLSPDHRAVADLVAPDAPRYAGVEPPETAVHDPLGPHYGVPEVGVGPVDYDVAFVGELYKLVYHLVGHVPGREHAPQHPRRLLLLDELLDAVGALGAVLYSFVDLAG